MKSILIALLTFCAATVFAADKLVLTETNTVILVEFAKCPLVTNVLSAKFEKSDSRNQDKSAIELVNELRQVRIFNNI